MLRPLALLALLLPAGAALAPAAPDAPRPEEFVAVRKGTLPIIISAPHGGRKKGAHGAGRAGTGIANFQTGRDENTAELAERLAAEIEKALDGKPWVVVA